MSKTVALLLVLLAAGALYWQTRPRGSTALPEVDSDVEECRDNLLAIYDGLRLYAERFEGPPGACGVAFFGELVASGVWENTRSTLAKLTCPGPNAAPMPEGADFEDLGSLTSASSAYAGRDTQNHPLARFPSGGAEIQALVACDNARGMNHDGALNVLYSDGSVKTLVLHDLIAQGTLPPGTTAIQVGPSSPVPELRTLVSD